MYISRLLHPMRRVLQSQEKRVIALCWLLYFTSYITRLSYGASMTEIILATDMAKTWAGLIGSAGFIAYGIGQTVSGVLGDRYKPSNIVVIGLVLSSVANILMALVSDTHWMLYIWFGNGLAQAMLWPPLLKILTLYVSPEKLKHAFVQMSAASSVGTIVTYFLVPVCIAQYSWKTVFYFTSVVGFLVTIIWAKCIKQVEHNLSEFRKGELIEPLEPLEPLEPNEITNQSLSKIIISSGLLWVIAAIILQGILKDGIISWTPTYITETFGVTTSLSILSTVLLPIFSIFAVYVTSFLYGRLFKDEMTGATVFFGLASLAGLLLTCFYNKNLAFVLITVALITGCMHGINLLLISIVPVRFMEYKKVATISGMLNAFTYLGSSISTYVIASLVISGGWKVATMVWAIVALVGFILSLLGIRQWRRFIGCVKII